MINLHPTDGTHWVLVIETESTETYYFDSFGVETPPMFLQQYENVRSNERMQENDEPYWGVYI